MNITPIANVTYAQLEKNSTLIRHLKTDRDFLEAAQACSCMEELHLKRLGLDAVEYWMGLYDTLWFRLRILSVDMMFLPPSNEDLAPEMALLKDDVFQELTISRFKNAQETRIQNLRFNNYGGVEPMLRIQQSMILKSPQLVRLQWTFDCCHPRRRTVLDLMIENLQVGQSFQQLESLKLSLVDVSRADLTALFESTPVLREFDLDKTKFDRASWGAFRDQILSLPRARTLTSLNFQLCKGVTGARIQDLLCTMDGLEVFKAGDIMYKNFTNDDRPWICLGLKTLCLLFRSDWDLEFLEQQHKFLDRVATLI
ncbi:hypothetical protein BGZ83_011877 [Gryganskiella cystojenkinii]|nr:hypothetical protein BGZ83_011877 [Gryganskiella cystojenkinii]